MSDFVIGDDGMVYATHEIVGEQVRGGQPQVLGGLGKDEAFHIIGEMVQKSPAFANYAAQKAAAYKPMVQKVPLAKARDWQIDFGPVSGAAGSTTTLTVNPQVLFRGEKVMATDSGTTAGLGTRIQSIFVGQKSQRPANAGSTLTLFFNQQALGNGIKWDTCEKALSISITVSFVTACTFDMTVFGKAVLIG